MSDFSIKTKKVSEQMRAEESYITLLGTYGDDVNAIRNNLSFKLKSTSSIDSRLRSVVTRLEDNKKAMGNMKTGLSDTVQKYERTETMIASNAKGDFKIEDISSNSGQSGALGNLGEALKDILVIGGTVLPVIDKIGDMVDFVEQFPDMVKDGIIDITSFETGISGGNSLYSNEISSEYGSASVAVGAYDYYANADGHVFTKDEDGNLVFDPSLSAAAGGTVCLFSAMADYAIGNQYLGAKANGEIVAGKASLEGEATIDFTNEDGHFDPTIKASADAEVVVVEAKGEAGVTVLGVEGKVNGSAYVGLGAHADIGYDAGVIEVNVGAALGLGVSVGFEVDVSGVQDVVQDVCSSVWDTVTGLF